MMDNVMSSFKNLFDAKAKAEEVDASFALVFTCSVGGDERD